MQKTLERLSTLLTSYLLRRDILAFEIACDFDYIWSISILYMGFSSAFCWPTYPDIFNLQKLENELSVISCDIKKNLDPMKLFNYICDNDLNDVFFETVKLLKLLFTIPVTTASSERSMSTLKRIKTYLRNSMGNERLSALSTLSIEKDIVGNCRKYPHFKERVIDHFATSKTRRLDLLFKVI